MSKVVSLASFRQKSDKNKVYSRWRTYFLAKEHKELLDYLIHEHENNFPLRSSAKLVDRMKHKALVDLLNEKAQTEFLKEFLKGLSIN